MGRQSRSPGAYGAGLLLLGLIAAASAQESSPDPDERRNRVTPTIRTHIYDRMLEAETCLGEGDSDCALSLLDQLSALRDLNTFEIANLHNFYAVVWYERDDFAAAATSYEKVLALPPAELTDGLIQAAMKNLSSTYWNLERPHDALELLDRWMALPTVTPLPRDWHLKATMHYQVEEYPQGIEALQAAIALAADQGEIGEEAWYQLLAAMYDELEQTERVIETLTILVENWTHLDNLLQLAGQLSLADRDDDTLALFEAAYEVGWLTSSNHLTTLASLYLQAEIPYQAAVVLEQGLGNGRIEPAQRNWDMLGQAWQRAGHHEQAVPVLEQASMLAEGGNVDVRLAQSYARLGRYAECIEVSRRGLERGGISLPDNAQIQLGLCYIQLKAWDAADAAFVEAEKSERSRESARRFRAYVLSLRNHDADMQEMQQLADEIEARIRAEAESDAVETPAISRQSPVGRVLRF